MAGIITLCEQAVSDETEMKGVILRAQPPAKRGTGRGRVGGRPVTEQGVLRNLNKRKSARRGDDYDGAQASMPGCVRFFLECEMPVRHGVPISSGS